MNIFLARPGYGGGASPFTEDTVISAFARALSAGDGIMQVHIIRSLLSNAFNRLKCECQNRMLAGESFDWFVLLHSDMSSPDPDWLTQLIAVAETHHLDVVAANARIKQSGEQGKADGDTSTAILTADGEMVRIPARRLRMLPPVLTDAYARESMGGILLVNTGMLLIRLGQSWFDDFYWTIEDAIRRDESGQYIPIVVPEDWRMSMWLAERGIPYGVAQEVRTIHGDEWRWDYWENGIDGWMTTEDLRWLGARAREMETVVEVGAYKGRTTDALCRNCPRTVWAVDTWEGTPGQLDEKKPGEDLFTEFRRNIGSRPNLKILCSTSLDAARTMNGNISDMTFIDADHHYEAVKADIAAWLPLTGRLICGHDIDEVGVRRAVDEAFGPGGWTRISQSIWAVDLAAGNIGRIHARA